MLIPINREKFEQLIPLIATGLQYNYSWGKFPDFLNRLLISVLGIVVVWIMHLFLGSGFDAISLVLGVGAGFYWLWGPIYWASQRNNKFRSYKHSGFWRGRVLDIYVTDELTREEESVNKKGELVITENRERRLNIEVGDETGFRVELQVPLKRIYKQIARGQTAEMLVVAHQPSFKRLDKFTDIYLPEQNLWVSDYPYLQRQVFEQLSQRIDQVGSDRPQKSPNNNNYRNEEEYDDYDDRDDRDDRLEDNYGNRDNYLEEQSRSRSGESDRSSSRKSSRNYDSNYDSNYDAEEFDRPQDQQPPRQLPPRKSPSTKEPRRGVPVKNRSNRNPPRRPRA